MRKNFGAQPWIYPQPVLIIASYGEDGTPDAMNAAWGGVADRSRIAMYLSGGHKTLIIPRMNQFLARNTLSFSIKSLTVGSATRLATGQML